MSGMMRWMDEAMGPDMMGHREMMGGFVPGMTGGFGHGAGIGPGAIQA